MDVVPQLRGRFGRPYTFVDRCASTQRLLDGAREGSVVATDEQTEGRGRLGRTWQAPAGSSLLFSIVLEPNMPSGRLPELSLMAGAAVAEALAAQANVKATIKHPNDVLLGGRKLAGILAESAEGRVVLGIGVNVTQARDELPSDADPPATSLALEGVHADRGELLAAILERLEAHYDRWVSEAGT